MPRTSAGLPVSFAARLLGIGFFVALVLAWYHGEKGQQRATGFELLIIAGLLLVAGGWKSTFVVTEIYQQADDETLLRVMTEGAELREVG